MLYSEELLKCKIVLAMSTTGARIPNRSKREITEAMVFIFLLLVFSGIVILNLRQSEWRHQITPKTLSIDKLLPWQHTDASASPASGIKPYFYFYEADLGTKFTSKITSEIHLN